MRTIPGLRTFQYTSILALLTMVPFLHAQRPSAERVWTPDRPRPDFPGEFLPDAGEGPAWQIRHTNSGPLEVRLWTVTNPSITNHFYAIRGRIAYDQVQGEGYLEMWNVFSPLREGLPEGRYFSRTKAESGELGSLRGTSGWRDFVLPFDRTGTSNGPIRLEVNLHLAGPGVVRLGPLRLMAFSGTPGPATAFGPRAWWTPRMTGILGGTAGAVLGILGGILGSLSARGRARSFVLTSTQWLMGLGVVLMVAGLLAVAQHQPPHVWTALLFTGLLVTGIFGTNYRSIRRQFAELELRRMTALDASSGG